MSHIHPPKALCIQIFMILHQCHFISAIYLSKLFFKMTTFTVEVGGMHLGWLCFLPCWLIAATLLVSLRQDVHPLLLLQACNMPGAWPRSQELLVAGQLVLRVSASGHRTETGHHRLHLDSHLRPACKGRWSIHSGFLGGLLPAFPCSGGRSD